MSQFSENGSSLMSHIGWETSSIDLQLHTEDSPSHKWESLDYLLWTPLLTDGNKTYGPNLLGCSCDNGLMWSFYTHFQKGHRFQKLIAKQVEAVSLLVRYNGGQKLRTCKLSLGDAMCGLLLQGQQVMFWVSLNHFTKLIQKNW